MARALLLVVIAGCGMSSSAPDGGGDGGPPLICPPSAFVEVVPVACTACIEDVPGVDDDADGLSELDGDCDDRDRFVGPSAREVCDLRDNDCDGAVDEDACTPVCPLSYTDIRCCGLTHAIGGTFSSIWMPDGVATGDWDYGNPWAVVLRRRDTGEMRLATNCTAPPRTASGYQYRFLLVDEDFVEPNTGYQVLIDMQSAFPAVTGCEVRLPVFTTDVNATVCGNAGQARAICR